MTVKRPCSWCAAEGFSVPSTDWVPDLKDRVCQAHAEDFWKRLVRTGSALSELRRAWDRPSEPGTGRVRPRASSSVPGALATVQLPPCPECGRFDPSNLEIPTQAECFRCGAVECPAGEPLHFQHDGCPACGYHGVSSQGMSHGIAAA